MMVSRCVSSVQTETDPMLQKELPAVAALAFLGDAVHSRYIRTRLVEAGISHSKDLNAEAQKHVTATAQEAAFERIRPLLTEEETDLCRRAYNTGHINRPKNVSGATYRTATAFEALLGMLDYLGETERLDILLRASYAQ